MWGMIFEPTKCRDLTFTKNGQKNYSFMFLNDLQIPRVTSHKHLGFYLDCNLNFSEHIEKLVKKIQKKLNPMSALSHTVKSHHLNVMYNSFISPHFDYCDIIYNSASAVSYTHLTLPTKA